MKQSLNSLKSVFQEIGKVRWTQSDALAVKTKRGATFLLNPNSDDGVPTRVHIDEIEVPESLRKRGVATEAMTALCHLADKYQFKLEGGPIGWSETLRRDEFVEWVLSFGFQRDPSPLLPEVDDPTAFYVCRQHKRG
jgi:hypothetical protein